MVLHFNAHLLVVMTGTTALHMFWLSKPEHRGGIKAYRPKISGFEKFFKQHRPRNIAPTIAVGKLSLPACVVTHLDEKLICTWADYTHKVLYVTMKCASDG